MSSKGSEGRKKQEAKPKAKGEKHGRKGYHDRRPSSGGDKKQRRGRA